MAERDDLPEQAKPVLAIRGVVDPLNAMGEKTESGSSGGYPLVIRGVRKEVNPGTHCILFLLVPPLELLNAAGRVHQFLLAGVEGVAVRAKVDTPAADGGVCLVFRTTGTGKSGLFVFWMDLFSHRYYSLLLHVLLMVLKRTGFCTTSRLFTQSTLFRMEALSGRREGLI